MGIWSNIQRGFGESRSGRSDYRPLPTLTQYMVNTSEVWEELVVCIGHLERGTGTNLIASLCSPELLISGSPDFRGSGAAN